MKATVLFLIVSLVLSVSAARKLPPDFKTCKRDDSKLSECLKDAFQVAFSKLSKGIPTLNVPPLQPISIPSVTLGEGLGAVNVVQKYTNYKAYNFGKGTVEKLIAKVTPTDLMLDVEIYYPELRIEADYSFDGKILSLPIVGNGKCTIKFFNVKIKANIRVVEVEKKGVKYLEVIGFKSDYNPGKVEFNYENLFNGDAQLGDAMNKVLNDNWEVVFKDVKGSLDETTSVVGKDYANKFLSKVPYDELL